MKPFHFAAEIKTLDRRALADYLRAIAVHVEQGVLESAATGSVEAVWQLKDHSEELRRASAALAQQEQADRAGRAAAFAAAPPLVRGILNRTGLR